MRCALGGGAKARPRRSLSHDLLSATILSAGVAAALVAVSARPAWAQTTEGRFSLNVAETSLTEALRIIQNSTGTRFVFSPDQLRTVRTKGLSGSFTVVEALTRMLDGLGFEAQRLANGSYLIVELKKDKPAPVQRAAQTPAPPPPSPPGLPAPAAYPLLEVIVTAERRVDNMQNIPVSLRALTSDVIEQRQISAFDDYAKLLPSVSFTTLGPGRSNVFFRGISTGDTGLLPTSGMYFDEIPVTTAGRTLDIHLYDIARIEALSGPQGTLFGASSLSGTVRIITNKPDPSHFFSRIDVQANKFSGGDAGALFEGFTNIPLSDRAAVRIVGFYEKVGGYIDNTPATITYQLGDDDPNTHITVNNEGIARSDVNSVKTYGGRVAGILELNDRWTVSPQILYQTQDAEGSFLFDSRLNDLEVHDFSLTRNHDRWLHAALAIEGEVGIFDIIYSAGYLSRRISNDNDYTYYSVAYDAIPGYTKFPDGKGGFLDPTQQYHVAQRHHKTTHELRISTPTSSALRATAGLFHHRQRTRTHADYFIPGFSVVPNTNRPRPVYGDDIYLIYTRNKLLDYAGFVEGTYDLTDSITASAGLRYFGYESGQRGFNGTARAAARAGCALPLPTPDACAPLNGYRKGSGETHKVNVKWQVDPYRMVYFTYSTGYRPGGFNSIAGVRAYDPDTLDNYEFGFKTTWHNVFRLNGAIYFEQWNGLQYRLVAPGNNGSVGNYNAGRARVYGAEADATWVISDEMMIAATAAYNDAALSRDLCQLDTTLNPLTACQPGPTMAAPKGTRLPSQPRFKFAGTGRYTVPVGAWDVFGQASLQYQSSTRSHISTLENSLLGNTEGFATVDVAAGGELNTLAVEFFVQNIFNKRGELSRNTFCAIQICTASRSYPAKPRLFGISIAQRF